MVGWYVSLQAAMDRRDLEQARRDQRSIAEKTLKLRANGYMVAIKAELNQLLANEGLYFGTPRPPVFIPKNF